MEKLIHLEHTEFELILRSQNSSKNVISNISERNKGSWEYKTIDGNIKKVYRKGFEEVASDNIKSVNGPRLYEETNYHLLLRTNQEDCEVTISHEDPLATISIQQEEPNLSYGVINFGSQVGFSRFTIYVNGSPTLRFNAKVFPSKLDFESDYKALMSEVQDILYKLAFEYVKSTFQQADHVSSPSETDLEWLTLLKHYFKDLDKSIRHIAHHPQRDLARHREYKSVHKIKKTSNSVRKAIRKQKGKGPYQKINSHITAHSRLPHQVSRPTLDTPEHRWLKQQLQLIRQQLSRIVTNTQQLTAERKQKLENESKQLQSDLSDLLQLPPFQESEGNVPSGFTSLRLLTAPGYREAYKTCLILQLGLRISGGPLELSLKKLHKLYEYWCYLSLLNHLAKTTNSDIKIDDLFNVTTTGLSVQLESNHTSTLLKGSKDNEVLSLTFQKKYNGDHYLYRQQPDLLLKISQRNNYDHHVVIDAKYRLEKSGTNGNSVIGPPQGALDALHRYRDAILNEKEENKPEKIIVQSVAAYPFRDKNYKYPSSNLKKTLDKIGVGAIPYLPSQKGYMHQWVNNFLQKSGWELAETSIPHYSQRKLHRWHQSAKEFAVIGTLNPKNRQAHLEWIEENKLYYMPYYETQPRQLLLEWLALYIPKTNNHPGLINKVYPVKDYTFKTRREIETPWNFSRNPDDEMVLYKLNDPIKLDEPILKKDKYPRSHFWSTKLALNKANNLNQIFLETVAEWRLYDFLQARNINFSLKPIRPNKVKSSFREARVEFNINGKILATYNGLDQFLIERNGGKFIIGDFEKILKML